MFEGDDCLITFELLFPFSVEHSGPVRRLPNHRTAYLEYEGEISGGRGEVERVMAGDFQWLDRSPNRMLISLKNDWNAVLELSQHETFIQPSKNQDSNEKLAPSEKRWELNWHLAEI